MAAVVIDMRVCRRPTVFNFELASHSRSQINKELPGGYLVEPVCLRWIFGDTLGIRILNTSVSTIREVLDARIQLERVIEGRTSGGKGNACVARLHSPSLASAVHDSLNFMSTLARRSKISCPSPILRRS